MEYLLLVSSSIILNWTVVTSPNGECVCVHHKSLLSFTLCVTHTFKYCVILFISKLLHQNRLQLRTEITSVFRIKLIVKK